MEKSPLKVSFIWKVIGSWGSCIHQYLNMLLGGETWSEMSHWGMAQKDIFPVPGSFFPSLLSGCRPFYHAISGAGQQRMNPLKL